jgi:hypothetical protein
VTVLEFEQQLELITAFIEGSNSPEAVEHAYNERMRLMEEYLEEEAAGTC